MATNLIDTDLKEQIRLFEKEANLIFPDELSQFLLKNNGLAFDYPSFTRIVDETFEQGNSLVEIMSFEEIKKVYFNLQDDEYFTKAIPNAKLLPFGETLGSPIICMTTSPISKLHGKIYVFDWDFKATYQADSLADFLSQLRVYEEVLV